jgi:hypothetical protein
MFKKILDAGGKNNISRKTGASSDFLIRAGDFTQYLELGKAHFFIKFHHITPLAPIVRGVV